MPEIGEPGPGVEITPTLNEAQDAYHNFCNNVPVELKPYLSILFTITTRKVTQDYKRSIDKLDLGEAYIDPEKIKQHLRLSLKPKKLDSFERLLKLMESVK